MILEHPDTLNHFTRIVAELQCDPVRLPIRLIVTTSILILEKTYSATSEVLILYGECNIRY